jgi:CopA family copper-resistance protein
VLVQPHDDRPYTVFAQAIDRSGYARGTLTADPSLMAELPGMDPAPILTHADMGMAMDHSMHGMDHARKSMAGNDHDRHGMTGMDHGQHDMGRMDHSQHDMSGMAMATRMPMGSGLAGYGSAEPMTHDEVQMGPQVDMLADAARYRLDDPGIGLRNNGRRVLTYADLFRLGSTDDPREPEREINLHLTGNMNRYMWSMNGIKFADAEPLLLEYGERVRINLVNDTMMNHPIHLHGMWSDLETGEPGKIPRKHTVIVQSGAMLSYLVTADALGGWAYHCHLLYHMPGMFRKVVVS